MPDQQFMQAYQIVSLVLSFISVGLYLFGAVKVFSANWPSSGKQLIGFGLVIHALLVVASIAVQFAQKLNQDMGHKVMLSYYALIHVASVIVIAIVIFGVVQLLRRNTLLEQIQQEDEDDRSR